MNSCLTSPARFQEKKKKVDTDTEPGNLFTINFQWSSGIMIIIFMYKDDFIYSVSHGFFT